MTKPIPKWVMERYSRLWNKFENKEMFYEDIQKTLSIDQKNVISVFLNELKNAGWIEIKLSEKDLRKRTYQLKSPNVVISQLDYGIKRS